MLILRETLIGKDQDRVLRERAFDRSQIHGVDWLSQVDVANFGRKAWRDWIDGDGHDHVLGARGFIGVGRIESRWTTACNRLGKILKPGRRGRGQPKNRSPPWVAPRDRRGAAASLASVQLLRVRTYGRARRGRPARCGWPR